MPERSVSSSENKGAGLPAIHQLLEQKDYFFSAGKCVFARRIRFDHGTPASIDIRLVCARDVSPCQLVKSAQCLDKDLKNLNSSIKEMMNFLVCTTWKCIFFFFNCF